LHQPAESAQTHLGVAYDAVPEPDERSVLQQVANAVLSGGMSGRLFTEVRERRGLCYSVFSRYSSDRDLGMMVAYAGTSAAQAQETLNVLVGELRRLSEGVDPDEFARAVVGMKAGLVMQGEWTAARAGAIAADQLILGGPRSLEELAERVSAVRLERLNDFLRQQRPGPMTVVSIGPVAVEPPDGALA
jgi:predicted Zn-dependent peptidase